MIYENNSFDPLEPSTWFKDLFQDTALEVSLCVLYKDPEDYQIIAATEQILFTYSPSPWIMRIRWTSGSRRVLKPEVSNSDADEGIWLEWTNKLANHWATEWLRRDLMPTAAGQLPQLIPLDVTNDYGPARWTALFTFYNQHTKETGSAIIDWYCPIPDSPDFENTQTRISTWSLDTTAVLDMLPIGMMLLNTDGVVLKVNNWLRNHEPSIRSSKLPQHWETIFHPDWLIEQWSDLVKYQRASYMTPWLHPYDGHTGLKHGPYTISLTPSEQGAVLQLTPLHDIIRSDSNDDKDRLTGLYTRAGWVKEAQEQLKLNPGQPYWLGVIGLDRFQSINDTLGHQAGDWLLQEVANRIKIKFPTATSARWTGDEFCILSAGELPHNPFVDIFKEPLRYKAHDVNMTCSGGITDIPAHRIETISQWVQYAEWALRDAKEQGRSRTVKAANAVDENRKNMFYIENGLANAVKLKQFFLLFQPLIRLSDKKIIGAEALLRWQHPEIGIIQPQYFIPVAEQTGAIAPMTAWVLESACLDALTWKDDLASEDFFLSVNLSPSQFYDPNLVDDIHGLIAALDFPATSLKLEITEGVVLQDTDHNRHTLDRLMRLGVGLAIDDFGTGYSSLAYLKNFPVQQLKIDKTFVQGIQRPHNRLLTENIIKLAHNMNMLVVAEGVETEEQEQMLKEMNCDMAQGYRFGRPMTSSALKTLLDHQYIK